MDLTLNETQLSLMHMARDFANRKLTNDHNSSETFPQQRFRLLANLGFTGLGIKESQGGGGGGLLEACIVIEEIARVDPSLSLALMVSLTLTTMAIANHGSEGQVSKYIPALAEGSAIGAFAYTEPNAGSDAAAIKSTACQKGDTYSLQGEKIFITNGDVANTYIVFATVNPNLEHRGISAFIVEKGTPGLRANPMTGKLGMRGSTTASIQFADCRVAASNLIGDEGSGFRMLMQVVDGSRPAIGAQAVGIGQGALDAALKYTSHRQQFGQSIANFQGVQFMLADMATSLEAARLLIQKAANLRDLGLPNTKDAAIAKLFATETASKIASKALQLHGGYGYFENLPLSTFLRDSKVTEIYEGTSEIMRLIIARQLLASQP